MFGTMKPFSAVLRFLPHCRFAVVKVTNSSEEITHSSRLFPLSASVQVQQEASEVQDCNVQCHVK